MADGKAPTAAVLQQASGDAEAAAEVDERWVPLRARLREARDRRGTPAFEPAVDALVDECERVNDIVRAGGKVPEDSPA